MRLQFGLAIAAMVASCAVPQSQVAPQVEFEAREPLLCRGADQCSIYWKRAQLWVAKNSRWKIQTATDVVIETYTPMNGSVNRGYKILREPQVEGVERITIASGCANMFGCAEGELEQAYSFKRFVRSQ